MSLLATYGSVAFSSYSTRGVSGVEGCGLSMVASRIPVQGRAKSRLLPAAVQAGARQLGQMQTIAWCSGRGRGVDMGPGLITICSCPGRSS